jgi:hypothetical protein
MFGLAVVCMLLAHLPLQAGHNCKLTVGYNPNCQHFNAVSYCIPVRTDACRITYVGPRRSCHMYTCPRSSSTLPPNPAPTTAAKPIPTTTTAAKPIPTPTTTDPFAHHSTTAGKKSPFAPQDRETVGKYISSNHFKITSASVSHVCFTKSYHTCI